MEFGGQNLHVLDVRYWGVSMLSLLAARKIMFGLFNGKHAHAVRLGFNRPGRLGSLFELFVRTVMRFEIQW